MQSLMHRAKLLQLFSQHPMVKKGSAYFFSFVAYIPSYFSKQNLIGPLNAEKIAEAVLLYVFKIGFPAPLLVVILS